MGPVQQSIRATVREGDELATPSAGRPFWVGRISGEGIVLELGAQRTPTLFRWETLEGVVPFLSGRGDVAINGSGKDTGIVAGTLDGYLKAQINRLTAGWVAALLEKASIVLVLPTRPARVRLR